MLLRLYFCAFLGYWEWKRLERKCSADLYILMPKAGEPYNVYALLYLDELLKKRTAVKNIVILTFDGGVKKSLPMFSGATGVRVLDFPRVKAERLLKYYALYEFSPKLMIVSLTEPYDTCGENLIGIKGITKEDLLCLDIYRLDEPIKKPFPDYSGTDQEIVDFIALGKAGRENGRIEGTNSKSQ